MATVYRTPLTKLTEAASVVKADSTHSCLNLLKFKRTFPLIRPDDLAAEYELDGSIFLVFYYADRATNVCNEICQHLNEEGDRCFNALVGSSILHKKDTYKFVPVPLGDSQNLLSIATCIVTKPSRATDIARSNRKRLSQKNKEEEAELAYRTNLQLSQIESKKMEIQEMGLSRSNQIKLMTEFLVNGDYTEVCKHSFGLTENPRANALFFAANVKKIYDKVAVKHSSSVKKEAKEATFETGEDKSIGILQQMLQQASPVFIASHSAVVSKPQPKPGVYSIADQKKSYYAPPTNDLSTSYYSANSNNNTPKLKPLPEYNRAPRGTSCAYCKFGTTLYSANYKAIKEGFDVSSLRSHYTQNCPINAIKELFAPKPTCNPCAPSVSTIKSKKAPTSIQFDEDGYAMVPRSATRKCEEKSNGSGNFSNGCQWSLLDSVE